MDSRAAAIAIGTRIRQAVGVAVAVAGAVAEVAGAAAAASGAVAVAVAAVVAAVGAAGRMPDRGGLRRNVSVAAAVRGRRD